jgi:excisionase family DNA binding protein
MSAALLYTVAETAEILQVTKRWLEDRVASQTIPHRRMGKFIRFTLADIELLIEQCAKTPVRAKGRRPV